MFITTVGGDLDNNIDFHMCVAPDVLRGEDNLVNNLMNYRSLAQRQSIRFTSEMSGFRNSQDLPFRIVAQRQSQGFDSLILHHRLGVYIGSNPTERANWLLR